MATQENLSSVTPQFLVLDLPAACAFYCDRLGFAVDFIYGEPPFYAGMSRDGVAFHLKSTCEPEPSREFKEHGEHLDAYMLTSGQIVSTRCLRSTPRRV